MRRNLFTGAIFLTGSVAVLASPASAEHDHFLRTPGGCHQVAAGSTAQHHQFHEHVHVPVGRNSGPLDPANLDVPPVALSTTPC